MRNRRFVKNWPHAPETQFFIEPHHRDLRVQINSSRVNFLCRRDRALQQFSSHSFAPVTSQDGHPADFRAAAPDDQSRGACGSSRNQR